MVLVMLSTFALWVLLMLFFYAFMKAHGIHAGGDLNPKFKKKAFVIFKVIMETSFKKYLLKQTENMHMLVSQTSKTNHSLLVAVIAVTESLSV